MSNVVGVVLICLKDALRAWEELEGGADYDTVIITGGGAGHRAALAPQFNHGDVGKTKATSSTIRQDMSSEAQPSPDQASTEKSVGRMNSPQD